MNSVRHTVTSGALALAATLDPAHAADLSPPLGKAEVVKLIVDQKISYVRKRDQAKQALDFKGSGTVYFTTSTTVRNTAFSGTYTLGDDGVVCLKWNSDKFVAMKDDCIVFRRDGDKLVLASERAPDAPYGEVIE